MSGAMSTRILKTEKDVVKRFFKLLQSKDLSDFPNIFERDAVVSEPFSQARYLRGQSEIKPFLKIALSATGNMQHRIRLEELQGQDNKLSAFVSFDRTEDGLKGQFTFELDPESKKIRKLEIQFMH